MELLRIVKDLNLEVREIINDFGNVIKIWNLL